MALAHLPLFQELLGTPNLLLVLWTRSYEMAFYLLVVGLFTVRSTGGPARSPSPWRCSPR